MFLFSYHPTGGIALLCTTRLQFELEKGFFSSICRMKIDTTYKHTMEQKHGKQTSDKNTKEMSSDKEKAQHQQPTPPPKGPGNQPQNDTKTDSSDADAQKGHA